MSYTLTPDSLRGRAAALAIRAAGWLTRGARHKGLYRAAKILGRYINPAQRCTHRWDDCAFTFDLADPYWSRNLAGSYQYEPEVVHLMKMLPRGFALLDCGANFGYWSVVATSASIGAGQAIAVEASPATCARLQENADLNANRFQVLNRAVGQQDDQTVTLRFDLANHSGASIAADAEGAQSVDVQTCTISSLVGMLDDPDALVLLKLDVEGVEREAMGAADALLARDFMVLYEDHAKEVDSPTTRFFLQEMAMQVYFVTDDGDVMRIENVDQVTPLKVQKGRGYNFIATRAGTGADRLMAAQAEAG